ncbi:nucleotide sugar dehydrogenase, partial [Mesorhizobium sp. M00.F.Ca.ET.038.03.1.1]
DMTDLNALVLAVPHKHYSREKSRIFDMIRPGGTLFDVKSAIKPEEIPENIRYWSL